MKVFQIKRQPVLQQTCDLFDHQVALYYFGGTVPLYLQIIGIIKKKHIKYHQLQQLSGRKSGCDSKGCEFKSQQRQNFFFINQKKIPENMLMVAPSSGQSSHGLAINTSTSCFWGSTRSNITPRNVVTKKMNRSIYQLLLFKQNSRKIAQL